MTQFGRIQSRLNTRLDDARQLVEIHTVLTGDGRGRRYDVDALNRGAVILSIAAWEAFIEDLALINSQYLSVALRSAEQLPDNVKQAFLSWLHGTVEFKNPTPAARDVMWSLTGGGWRRKFREFAKDRVEALHAPSPQNVRKLFRAVLDIDDITESWEYRQWGADVYRDKLDQTLLLRHRIAHGAIGTETVGKIRARAAISLVASLSQRSSDAVKRNFERFDLKIRRRRIYRR